MNRSRTSGIIKQSAWNLIASASADSMPQSLASSSFPNSRRKFKVLFLPVSSKSQAKSDSQGHEDNDKFTHTGDEKFWIGFTEQIENQVFQFQSPSTSMEQVDRQEFQGVQNQT